MRSNTVRVVVVERNRIVRSGILSLIERTPDLEVAGVFATAEEAAGALDAVDPDVIVFGVESAYADAQSCTVLVEAHRRAGVLALAASLNDELLHGCLVAGVRGYVLRETPAEELVAAMRTLARGASVLGPEVVTRVLKWALRSKAMRDGDRSLNAPELVVLSLVAQGLTNPKIARKLQVSEGAVKVHMGRVRRKLGVADRSQAVAAGIRRGII
ncbi:MAG TPA: response regulator transcription factor [Actinomycetota bacterium]